MVTGKVVTKVEFSTRETILAIGFVIATLVMLALVQMGVLQNPLTVGIAITSIVVLIFIGHHLTTKGIISREAAPLWYIFAFGIVMILYGLVKSGALAPAFIIPNASVEEVSLASALFYALIVFAAIGIIATAYTSFKMYKRFKK